MKGSDWRTSEIPGLKVKSKEVLEELAAIHQRLLEVDALLEKQEFAAVDKILKELNGAVEKWRMKCGMFSADFHLSLLWLPPEHKKAGSRHGRT